MHQLSKAKQQSLPTRPTWGQLGRLETCFASRQQIKAFTVIIKYTRTRLRVLVPKTPCAANGEQDIVIEGKKSYSGIGQLESSFGSVELLFEQVAARWRGSLQGLPRYPSCEKRVVRGVLYNSSGVQSFIMRKKYGNIALIHVIDMDHVL